MSSSGETRRADGSPAIGPSPGFIGGVPSFEHYPATDKNNSQGKGGRPLGASPPVAMPRPRGWRDTRLPRPMKLPTRIR